MDNHDKNIAERFIDRTELYPNKKLQLVLIFGLAATALFLVIGIALGVLLLWVPAIPLIILGAVAFAGTMASALAAGPHIGLHREYLIWRLVGTRYSFMRWDAVDTVESGGPEDRPTLIIINGARIDGRAARVRVNPKNYRRGDKLLEEIVRRYEWAVKRG